MRRVHRKTTRAALLVTVALSALSGCVTVQRPPSPGPDAGAARLSEPHPDTRTRQAVQAPAREALEMIAPSRPKKSPASPSRRATSTAPAPRGTAPPDDRNRRPAPGGPVHGRATPPRTPDAEVSEAAEALRRDLRGRAEVCALGREYGHWPAGSPEAAICEETYGR
ncbi:hypothetical protein SAMN05216505_10550 [Streptomyces prasinopilosus]|uniref:Lipoprotein n=1 Tax=Streptomyces prasinopilosus TaxID=67344 RepID=A0A1G6RX66_9ACTN|nr:hypothetical protein [Streptomyces prasinopilosus]SDD09043.1 hypothetical protein SAMN05216505_10550 [Streptomyces prasinopilosus]